MEEDNKIIPLCVGTELVLYTDGCYELRHSDVSDEIFCNDVLYFIQCYSNGCVNKVSIENILALRYDYKYSHGIYPNTKLLASNIVTDEDSICVEYMRNGTLRQSSINISSLRTHSMLGLRGADLIGVTFDEIIGWFINDKQIGYSDKNINPIKPIEEHEIPRMENVISADSSNLTTIDDIAGLEGVFREYLKSGKNIPIGQNHAKEVLAQCRTKEQFWHVIETLLRCDTHVYRSPIVEYINEYYASHYEPNVEILSTICDMLFSIAAKPEKNLDFLYPFKDILNEDIKNRLTSSIKSLAQPEQYQKLCDILGLNVNERIDFCLEQSNAASYYYIYDLLLNVHKKEGYFAVSKLINNYIDYIDDASTEGKLIKRLIYFDIKKAKDNPGAEVIKIKTGGFFEYSRICTSYEGKKKSRSVQNSITTLVGKRITAKYVATYSNHYFLMTSNGIRVLLPKNMSERVLREGTSIEVMVAYADQTYNTLYATQKAHIDYKKIMRMPLLNNGDIIEVSFDLYGAPVPHKCYKKIKIQLDSYPNVTNNQSRFRAKVIRQTTDKYHYVVKII